MQLLANQSITPPFFLCEGRTIILTLCAFFLLTFTACQTAPTICGVPAQGSTFDLLRELTYNPNATAHPFDYLICQEKAYIYCEDPQGNTLTIICDLDKQHNIICAYH